MGAACWNRYGAVSRVLVHPKTNGGGHKADGDAVHRRVRDKLTNAGVVGGEEAQPFMVSGSSGGHHDNIVATESQAEERTTEVAMSKQPECEEQEQHHQ